MRETVAVLKPAHCAYSHALLVAHRVSRITHHYLLLRGAMGFWNNLCERKLRIPCCHECFYGLSLHREFRHARNPFPVSHGFYYRSGLCLDDGERRRAIR